MIDEQDEIDTVIFINENRQSKRLKTQAPDVGDSELKTVTKWQHNTFYRDIKRKIHQKLKTQPSNDHFTLFTNKKIQFNVPSHLKPKSKITISNLQIAIDPIQRKIQPTFQIQRKIYHKVESSVSMIKTKPNLPRNMSAKLTRDPPPLPANSSRSLIKKQLIQTCRKNSKAEPGNLKTKRSSKQLPFRQKQLQQPKLPSKRSLAQQSLEEALQNSTIYINRLRKSKSQKLQQQKSILKMHTFDTDPLLFYFKAKNTFKPANRQISIKKLRSRVKTENPFVGAPNH